MADTYLQSELTSSIFERASFAVNTKTQTRLAPEHCEIILPLVQTEGGHALLEATLAQSIDLEQNIIIDVPDSQVVLDLITAVINA